VHEQTGKTFIALLTESLSDVFGPTWTMRAANLGRMASSIRAGCPDSCDGFVAADCASAFDEIAVKHYDKVGLVFHAIANDPRPWAERGGGT
jgi:hypothetical protein